MAQGWGKDEARMGQGWGRDGAWMGHGWGKDDSTRLPPMPVARVRFPDPANLFRDPNLMVPYAVPRGFSPGTPVFPSPQKPTFDLICVNLLISVYSVPNLHQR